MHGSLHLRNGIFRYPPVKRTQRSWTTSHITLGSHENPAASLKLSTHISSIKARNGATDFGTIDSSF
jgi:hypothetical protein